MNCGVRVVYCLERLAEGRNEALTEAGALTAHL